MSRRTVLAIHEYEGHRGLVAVGLGDPVALWTVSGSVTAADFFRGGHETVLYLANRGDVSEHVVGVRARDAGFEWSELAVGDDTAAERSLRIGLELAVRSSNSRRSGSPAVVNAPPSVANVPLEDLALELLSHLTVLEGDLPLGRRERSPVWTVTRRVFETVRENLGLELVDSSSKYRPDTCPDCGLRWDVVIDGRTGFERIASFVWKCSHCSRIVDAPMSSNRTVAKR